MEQAKAAEEAELAAQNPYQEDFQKVLNLVSQAIQSSRGMGPTSPKCQCSTNRSQLSLKS